MSNYFILFYAYFTFLCFTCFSSLFKYIIVLKSWIYFFVFFIKFYMRKKFIQSTFILFFGGFITKLLGLIIKIIMTRNIGLEGISLYMMILPTFSLFITIAQVGVPYTLSRMVALNKKNNPSLFFTTWIFLLVLNLLLCLFLSSFSSFISTFLLHNSNLQLPIIAIGFVLHFTTLSSLGRSYFIGKENMLPPVLSNIFENFIRFLFVLFIIPYLSHYSTSFIVFIIVLFNIISELCSFLVLLLFLPKKHISFTFSFQRNYLLDVLNLSFPNITSSLIGNVTYFLEPILFSSILLSLGYLSSFITQEYGILTGYVFPILFLPSFFMNALSQSFFSYQTKLYDRSDYKKLKFVFYLQVFLILFISIFFTLFFILFGLVLLKFIYHTSLGFSYLKVIAPFCFFYYVQPTFSFLFLSMGKTKDLLITTIISSVIRIVSLILFLYLNFGIYSLLYSFILNTIITTIYEFYKIHKYLS